MSKPTANMMPALYSHRIHDIQIICRAAGYAVAVHGSMQTDLDLVAFPWTNKATTPKYLVKRLCEALDISPSENSPFPKPHGRIVYTLNWMGAGYVDLSIMPRIRA